MNARAPNLPSELVLQIAGHCSQSSLGSLVLLNRRFYNDSILLLYQSVSLRDPHSISAFCSTIMTGNGWPQDDTRQINIQLRGQGPYGGDRALGESIKNMLLLVRRLEHLVLDLPLLTIRPIFDFERCPYPFMLRSLSIPVLANKGFTEFLGHNVHLEELDLASCMLDQWGEVPEYSFLDLEPNTLPRLRHLVVKWGRGSHLARNRPVSSIHLIGSFMTPNGVLGVGTLIGESTAPLVCLRLGLAVSHQIVNKSLTLLLSVLVGAQSTLEELNIALSYPDANFYMPAARIASSIDQVELRDRLSKFSVLESFRLETIERWRESTALEGASLSQPHTWQQACPNLKHFLFFGIDISSE
ncbi:hypothetical protein FRC08_003142 [Ceratobasidium sp. 394]|nr:hypothetical protein FRC08_003142 [Ceratobasidium sp. 394]